MDKILSSNNHCKVMVGTNMIMEGLALGAFNNMYRQMHEPLLKTITFNVMRDESRHVSFGDLYLTPTIAALHDDDREELAQFAFDLVKIIIQGQNSGLDNGFLDVLSTSEIEPQDFSRWIKEAQAQELSTDLPPGQIHSLKDLMVPALALAGLITPRTKELFEEVGVRINADLSALESLRGSRYVVRAANAGATIN